MIRLITLYWFITDITNFAKHPTDDWLTTFSVSHHILVRLAYQSPIWKFYCTFFLSLIFLSANHSNCRSQWSRGRRRWSAATRLLRLWVGVSQWAWLFVCCVCCLLIGRGLCDELITRPEVRVFVSDLETSRIRRLWPTGGCRAQNQPPPQTDPN